MSERDRAEIQIRAGRTKPENGKTFDAVLREAFHAGVATGAGPGFPRDDADAAFDDWKRRQLP